MDTTAAEGTKVVVGKKSFDVLALMREVDLATRVLNRAKPVGPGEKVIGILSEDMQRLLFVRLDISDEVRAMWTELEPLVIAHAQEHDEHTNTEESCAIFHKKHDVYEELMSTKDTVKTIFWELLKLQFPGNEGCDIGIAENMQVVVRPLEKEDAEEAFISLLQASIMGPGPARRKNPMSDTRFPSKES